MLPIQGRVCFFLLIYCGFHLLRVSQVESQTTERPDVCKAVRCSLPPKESNCNETKSSNPKIEKKLGAQKDCCPVYHCRNSTGEEYLFVGLNTKKRDANKTSTCENFTCPENPEFRKVGCITSTSPPIQVVEFAKGSQACCPVKSCFTEDGSLTKFGFAIVEGKLPSKERINAVANKCDEFTCATKPSSKTSSCQVATSNVGIAEPLGKLKDCCSVWECTYGDESVFYHYWIQGNNFRYKEIRSKSDSIYAEQGVVTTSERPNGKLTNKTVQVPPKKTGAGQPAECAPGEVCPRIKKDGCSSSFGGEDMGKFVPAEVACCPLTTCKEKRRKRRTHYAKLSGKIPTSQSEIAKEKGSSSKVKCPNILCIDGPKMPGAKLQKCSLHAGEPLIPKLKPFASCCSMFKCMQTDGSYSLELGMRGASFIYYEISFYKLPSKKSNGEGAVRKKASNLKETEEDGVAGDMEDSVLTIEKFVPGILNTARQIPVMNNVLTQPLFSL